MQEIPYKVIYSGRRKRASLTVGLDGRLTVNAPFSMNDADIEALVQRERTWIEATKAKIAVEAEERAAMAKEALNTPCDIPYRVDYSERRKRASLTVDKDGQLTVHAPLFMGDGDIAALVLKERAWIEATQAKMAAKAQHDSKSKEGAAETDEGAKAKEALKAAPCGIPYSIERSGRRRRAALSVNADGQLTVKAPLSMDDDAIAALVQRERAWIEATKAKMAAKAAERAAKAKEGDAKAKEVGVKVKEAPKSPIEVMAGVEANGQNEFTADGITFKVLRSGRRKCAVLSMALDGQLKARVPLSMPMAKIVAMVRREKAWIERAKQRVAFISAQNAAKAEEYPMVSAEPGSVVMYLGRRYTVAKSEAKARGYSVQYSFFADSFEAAAPIPTTVELVGDKMILPKNYGLGGLKYWLKRQAVKVLTERVDLYKNILKVTPASVEISEARSRWGVCTYRNNIRFVYRLIMCPLEVIDYVVVHELSHIIHKNHGRSFWRTVAGVLPDYKRRRQWLKDNKRLIDVI